MSNHIVSPGPLRRALLTCWHPLHANSFLPIASRGFIAVAKTHLKLVHCVLIYGPFALQHREGSNEDPHTKRGPRPGFTERRGWRHWQERAVSVTLRAREPSISHTDCLIASVSLSLCLPAGPRWSIPLPPQHCTPALEHQIRAKSLCWNPSGTDTPVQESLPISLLCWVGWVVSGTVERLALVHTSLL